MPNENENVVWIAIVVGAIVASFMGWLEPVIAKVSFKPIDCYLRGDHACQTGGPSMPSGGAASEDGGATDEQ